MRRLYFLLHLSLLVGQLRAASTGFVPLFSLASEELMTEVDDADVLLEDFHQMIEDNIEQDLVANMDQLIGNTIEEEEDLPEELDQKARADKAIANDFFNSKHLQSQPGQHLIKALPILDQLRNVSVDDSGNQAYSTLKGRKCPGRGAMGALSFVFMA